MIPLRLSPLLPLVKMRPILLERLECMLLLWKFEEKVAQFNGRRSIPWSV